MDRGLSQRDVAKLLGASAATLRLWEAGRTEPTVTWLPGIFGLLGGDPREGSETLAARLKRKREALGLSQRQAGEVLGIDPGTVGVLERGERLPKARRLRQLLDEWLREGK